MHASVTYLRSMHEEFSLACSELSRDLYNGLFQSLYYIVGYDLYASMDYMLVPVASTCENPGSVEDSHNFYHSL